MSKLIETLTHRQQQVFDLLVEYQKTHGYPPTNAELAALMGASSSNAAAAHLKALQKKGAITIAPNVSRGIVLNHRTAEQEAVSLIRSLVDGDANAREKAMAWLERNEVTV